MHTNSTPDVKPAKKDSASTAKQAFKLRGPNARSKVTNGVKLLPGFDGRSAWGRRFHDLCALHARDAGGIDALSEAQVSLIRRASALEVTLENIELDMALGFEVDLDQYSRAAGHLRRILETVGIKRVARDVSPSLADIIAAHRAKSPETPATELKAPASTSTADSDESRTERHSPPRDDALADEEVPE